MLYVKSVTNFTVTVLIKELVRYLNWVVYLNVLNSLTVTS